MFFPLLLFKRIKISAKFTILEFIHIFPYWFYYLKHITKHMQMKFNFIRCVIINSIKMKKNLTFKFKIIYTKCTKEKKHEHNLKLSTHYSMQKKFLLTKILLLFILLYAASVWTFPAKIHQKSLQLLITKFLKKIRNGTITYHKKWARVLYI